MAETADRAAAPVLSLRSVTQRFGAATVLNDISLEIAPGEVVAIVGENGAGKSTLMKIITGVLRPTEGEVRAGGHSIDTVRHARDAGVVLIPQELAYMPEETVANNVSVGHWPSRFGFVDRRKTTSIAQAAMRTLGGPTNLTQTMSSLTLGEQQLVEIGKAIALPKSRLLCFDEPTAALNRAESEQLLKVILKLKAQGTAAIYVSHRLDELRVIADKILVLRNGRIAGLLDAATADAGTIASLMLGREHTGRESAVSGSVPATRAAADSVQVTNWKYDGQPALTGATVTAFRGEVLGLYGLAGSGVESVARGLGGLLPHRAVSGSLSVFGSESDVFRSPVAARRAKVVYLPADRKHDGLMLSRSVQENLTQASLSTVSRAGLMSRRKEKDRAMDLMKRYQIRARGLTQPVSELSGGNQQKILFANRVALGPDVLVLHEPTRGVDVGARAEIHAQIRRASEAGACVILITTDIEEVVDVADRVAVMRHGAFVGELSGDDVSDDSVLSLAATKGNDE